MACICSDFDKRMGFDTEAKRELRNKVLSVIWQDSQAWKECWIYTNAYGTEGFIPPQGLDWSGFRDSTYTAVCRMAAHLGIK